MLLTYTPSGALGTYMTVTTDLGASSTASGTESNLVTASQTSTSATAASKGDAGRMKESLRRVLAATLVVSMMLNFL